MRNTTQSRVARARRSRARKSVDQDSTAIFIMAFFYHLLCNERDPPARCSDKQAVRRAASIDRKFNEGTPVFRYYSGDGRQ